MTSTQTPLPPNSTPRSRRSPGWSTPPRIPRELTPSLSPMEPPPIRPRRGSYALDKDPASTSTTETPPATTEPPIPTPKTSSTPVERRKYLPLERGAQRSLQGLVGRSVMAVPRITPTTPRGVSMIDSARCMMTCVCRAPASPRGVSYVIRPVAISRRQLILMDPRVSWR